MSRDLKPWQYVHHVCIRMRDVTPQPDPNAAKGVNRLQLHLGRFLQHIDYVELTEYSIENAGGTSDLWRLSFDESNLTAEMSTNAGGRGHCLVIPNFTRTHVVYDTPRTLSIDRNKGLNTLSVVIVDEFGADVTFDTMTIMLTFVMSHPDWSIEQVRAEDRNKMDWWRSQQFSSRYQP